jgi:adenylate kinase
MATADYRAVLLFGAPGVGKGTQGKVLGQIPGFFHLACGDVFRSLDIRSSEGREVSLYVSKGELVPDDVTIRIWKKSLESHIGISRFSPDDDVLILDGIPRNVRQAQIMEGYLDVLHVIHLVCSDEQAMIDRLKRRAIRENRADDANESVIRHRYEVYKSESSPVLSFYPPGIITQIESLRSPAEVCRDILECLIPVVKRTNKS